MLVHSKWVFLIIYLDLSGYIWYNDKYVSYR